MTDSAPTTLEEWKALAEDSARRLQDKETELDEFAQSSQELEEDLERELDQLRGEKATLEQAVVKVGEQLKARNATTSGPGQQSARDIAKLQDRVAELEEEVKASKANFVRLEQENDDLERGNRSAQMSHTTLDGRLETALESLAMVETELQERTASASEQIQRLKDDNRDLETELRATKMKQDRAPSDVLDHPPVVSHHATADAQPAVSKAVIPIAPVTPTRHLGSASASKLNAGPNSPLVLVTQMTMRVRELEERLASCRSSLQSSIQTKLGAASRRTE